MSITTITRSLPDLSIIHGMKGVSPDLVRTHQVSGEISPQIADADSYFLGCRFHLLLRRLNDHVPLTSHEKAMLPWLSVLRTELRNLGVSHFESEVRLPATEELPGGVCDLVVAGGLGPRGAIEIKVTQSLPDRPVSEHLLQLGGYAGLLAAESRRSAVWGALAYVSFQGAQIRVFAYADTRPLVSRTHRLFARKAA